MQILPHQAGDDKWAETWYHLHHRNEIRRIRRQTWSFRQILSLLADGIDPETGEILPEDSVCNQPEVIRALHFALDCLSHQKQRRMTSIFYVNQGKAWTAEEESLLTRLFRKGESNAQIQMELQRSESAVSARLVRLGLIEHREDYRARDKKHSENNFPY